MGDFNIHLVPLTIAPVIMFIIIAMLNIIGNILKTFSLDNGVVNVWFTLWSTYACSSAGACQLYGHRDLNDAIGGGDECSSFIDHYRAAEAFAIISTFFAGILVFFSVVFIVYQQQIGFEALAKRGIVVSGILFVLDLITFILIITLKDRYCITRIAEISLKPAAFMYLGGFVFALINCSLYYRIGQVFKVSATPNAPRYLPASNNLPQEEEQQQHQFSYRQRSPERSILQQQQPATVLVVDPRSPAINIVEQRAVSPIRVRSPMSSATRLRGSPVSSGEGLWPDGNDWQVDEPSGLLWSENKHLFFDRSSGQFFDPKSDQWYDPEADRWYKLQK